MKRTYVAIVEHGGKPETTYGVEFPDFPGCFSAADEAEDPLPMAREALALYIETMQEMEACVPEKQMQEGFRTARRRRNDVRAGKVIPIDGEVVLAQARRIVGR